jgi:hypothetical protein
MFMNIINIRWRFDKRENNNRIIYFDVFLSSTVYREGERERN